MDVGLTVEDSQKETCKQAASWVWYWIPFVIQGIGQLVLDLDKSLWPEKAGAWFFSWGADVDTRADPCSRNASFRMQMQCSAAQPPPRPRESNNGVATRGWPRSGPPWRCLRVFCRSCSCGPGSLASLGLFDTGLWPSALQLQLALLDLFGPPTSQAR